MAIQNLQFQHRTNYIIQNIVTKIGKPTTSINQIQDQGSNQLPAQALVNPIAPNTHNVSAINLRSGWAVTSQTTQKIDAAAKNKDVEILITSEPVDDEQQIPLHFPHRVVNAKKQEEANRDILDMF